MKRRILVILLALAMLITYIPVVAYADTEVTGDAIAEDQQIPDEAMADVGEPAEQPEEAEEIVTPPAEDPGEAEAEVPAEEPVEESAEEPATEPAEEAADPAVEEPEEIEASGDTAVRSAPQLKGAPLSGWVKKDGKWYYYDPEYGDMYKDDWYIIDVYAYYFDSDGVMQTGWIKDVWKYKDEETGEVYSITNWYYADSSGHLLSGFQTINGKKYYFDPDFYEMWYDSDNSYAWEIDGKHYYITTSGEIKTGWIKEVWGDGYVEWYYANSDGVLLGGWQKIGGKWYYFDPAGYWMYSNGIYPIDGKDYFFGENGALANGWAKYVYTYESWYSGPKTTYTVWYYTDANGAIQYGWKKISNKWYYFDPESGAMCSDTVRTINGDDYYFNESGVLQTGWIKKDWGDGYYSWYYANSSGVLQLGWQKISGSWYYFNDYGEMLTGFWVLDDKEYYFKDNGVWVSNPSGWVEDKYYDSSDWYYIKNGKAVRGWQKISGKWYFFETDPSYPYPYMYRGYCYVSDDGKYYFFDENGVWISNPSGWKQAFNGAWYYFKNGQAVTGWQKISGKWYYFYPYGIMAVGYVYVEEDGKYSYFNSSGVWVSNPSGWKKGSDGEWYYFTSGNPAIGWKKIDGKWYYFNTDGSMLTGWLELDGNWYYFNSSGVMQTGTLTINGIKYTFKSNGAWDGK